MVTFSQVRTEFTTADTIRFYIKRLFCFEEVSPTFDVVWLGTDIDGNDYFSLNMDINQIENVDYLNLHQAAADLFLHKGITLLINGQ